MPKSRATSGFDLHLELGQTRVRAGLEAALRNAIRGGRLRANVRLPSSRGLARDLGIGRNTVAEAYGQLVAEGWIETRLGAGTWVAEQTRPLPAEAASISPVKRAPQFDLRPGVPDLAAFPRSAWLAAARRALSTAAPTLLGYDQPQGIPILREALADYLARVRGVTATPDRVVICAGFSQSLDLICRVLRSRGARSLTVEGYGDPGHQRLIQNSGLATPTITVDSGGAVIDELGPTDGLLLTPAHQFPLGVSLEPARRRQLVQWAADTGALIIEDDYDGEFRYDRQPIGAMQALSPEQIVYAGTASKSLVPGLRLAWLVLPSNLVNPVLGEKAKLGVFSGAIDQLALSEFITSGAFDRHVRRMRLVYRRRRDRLLTALSRQVPGTEVMGIAAGLHVLIRLANANSEDETVKRASERGLILNGLRFYARGRNERHSGLVVGYAAPPDHAFTSAMARLTASLTQMSVFGR